MCTHDWNDKSKSTFLSLTRTWYFPWPQDIARAALRSLSCTFTSHARAARRCDAGWRLTRAAAGLFDRAHPYRVAARCFVQQHADLFGAKQPAHRRCPLDAPWRTARVAVEFHDDALPLFLHEILPQLPRLRARYAAACGTLLASGAKLWFVDRMAWLYDETRATPPTNGSAGDRSGGCGRDG